MNVAVIGASSDRAKFGNKAVRAWHSQGHGVFPVNPKESEIEGLAAYSSILDVPADLDAILVYLPPPVTLRVLPDIASKGARELYLNPGSEDDQVVQEAQRLGLSPILACAILAIGEHPDNFGA